MDPFEIAKQEIGEKEYLEHYKVINNTPILDYVRTIVINLPEDCKCNCTYCLDKHLRHNKQLDIWDWFYMAKYTINRFPKTRHVTITGGTINAGVFNMLTDYIKKELPEAEITWNTNGVDVYERINTENITHINLHRQSVDEWMNTKKFHTNEYLITLNQAKEYFGDKLTIRTVITPEFDLDEYAELGIPLFLNRQLPATPENNIRFDRILDKLDITDVEQRRNNKYYSSNYNGVPVRVGVGDDKYKHIPGRKPVFFNVAIVHRSGIVTGTWYEDDKVLAKMDLED